MHSGYEIMWQKSQKGREFKFTLPYARKKVMCLFFQTEVHGGGIV